MDIPATSKQQSNNAVEEVKKPLKDRLAPKIPGKQAGLSKKKARKKKRINDTNSSASISIVSNKLSKYSVFSG